MGPGFQEPLRLPGWGSRTPLEQKVGSLHSLGTVCDGPTKCQMLGLVPEEEAKGWHFATGVSGKECKGSAIEE